MGKRARKILNIVTAVVMVAIAALLLVMITSLIARNLSDKADSNDGSDIRSQTPGSDTRQNTQPSPGGKPGGGDKDTAASQDEPGGLPGKNDSGKNNPGSGDSGVSEEPGAGGESEETEPEDTVPEDTGAEDTAADNPESAEDPEGPGNPDGAEEAQSEAAQSEAAQMDEGILRAVETIAAKYGAVGVQVAVIKNGGIAGVYVYGDAVRGSRPMTADTKIRVASVSKVILTMAIMRLCELGQLDIDADIGVYWGAPVRNPNHADIPITMRQIMSHTSSIIVYDYGFAADGELVRRRFLDGSCFGRSTPGAIGSWNYNNYAFAALGLTVETALDETVNSIADRCLFAPLGIDAAFGGGSISDTGNIASLYTSGGGVGRSADAQRGTFGSTFPGERGEEFPGGLTISAYDLAKLIAALAGGGQYCGVRVLSPASVSLMETTQGRTGGFDQCLPLRRRANLYGRGELCYHTGSNYGVYNLISYDPISGDGVVVLTSGASGNTDSYGIYAVCGEITEYIYRNG